MKLTAGAVSGRPLAGRVSGRKGENSMKKKELGLTNMNGMRDDDDTTCGLNDMNCLGEQDDSTCGLNDMNCVEEEEDTTCGLNDMNCLGE